MSRRDDPGPMPHKVAAVCYRTLGGSVEFLLVKTKSGKWTFPKGNIEPHLSLAESAELEAREEAGALGTISDTHFDSYLHEKPGSDERSRALVVAAFLLSVEETFPPEETHRNPKWFSALEAKSRLAQRRSQWFSREFSRVIDSAVHAVYRQESRSRRRSRLQPPDSPRSNFITIW